MSLETLLIAVVAAVAAVAGVMVVRMRTAVHSALFLVLNFFCLAFLYLSLNAEFVAIVNVIVYAGAIMVLFLFVIFLINPTREEETDRPATSASGAGAGPAGAGSDRHPAGRWRAPSGNATTPATTTTNIAQIGVALHAPLFPSRTSLILLAAIIGAIVLPSARCAARPPTSQWWRDAAPISIYLLRARSCSPRASLASSCGRTRLSSLCASR
jgi:NADH-quinone oxidoreductase subunit J